MSNICTITDIQKKNKEKENNVFIEAINKAKTTVDYFKKCSDIDLDKRAELMAENDILQEENKEYSKILDDALKQIKILKTERNQIAGESNNLQILETCDIEKSRQQILSDKYKEKKEKARNKLNGRLNKLKEKMKILYE